jgi:hypothetical protein
LSSLHCILPPQLSLVASLPDYFPPGIKNILIQVYFSFVTGMNVLNQYIQIKFMGSSCTVTCGLMYCGLTLLLAAVVITGMASRHKCSRLIICWPCQRWTWMLLSDTVHMRPLYLSLNRPTVQPQPVSQLGSSPAPHLRFKTLLYCRPGLSGDTTSSSKWRSWLVISWPAGGGGAAGPAPDVRHQPPGDAEQH